MENKERKNDGVLSKGAGTFTIDHPLNLENKIIQHSFVEFPDMKNMYDGIVFCDKNGNAVVINLVLPEENWT